MTDKLENIEACVFDAYGTLFDVDASARNCAEEIGDCWLTFSALWRKKQLEYTWLRTLMGEYRDFWHVTGDALDYTMENFNMRDPALRSKLMELYLKLEAFPEVHQVLKALKGRGLKTVLLSNGSKTMLTSAVRKADLFDQLDGIYSVDDVGAYKVDPRVYRLACERLNLEPDQICFLSANPWDAAGASAFGMKVVWVNRFAQKEEKLGNKARPRCAIRSLDQLSDLIDMPDE